MKQEHNTTKSEYSLRSSSASFLTKQYIDSLPSQFIDDKGLEYPMSEKQLKTLNDYKTGLEFEMTTMSTGISSIGALLAIAADDKTAGIDLDYLSSLGWFLEYMGSEINQYSNTVSHIDDMISQRIET